MKRWFYFVLLLAAGAVVYFAIMDRNFYRTFRERAQQVKAAAGVKPPDAVTEADLRGLPEPVKRYMKASGVIGKKPVSSVRLKHSGRFRPGQNMKWSPIKGEYLITTNKPGFVWYGKLSMMPGISASACDSYFEGKGRMFVKAMGVIPVVDAKDHNTDMSAFGRALAELTMAPGAYLYKGIKWKPNGVFSAPFTFEDIGLKTEGKLYFNPDWTLDRVEVMRYFDRGNGRATLEKFVGKGMDTKDFGGYSIPSRFVGWWDLKEGKLEYVDFVVESAEFE